MAKAGIHGMVGMAVRKWIPNRAWLMLGIVLGNIRERSFEEIWRSEVLEQLRDRDRLKGKCGACRLRWLCSGCRAIPYALTGDHLGEDPQCFRRESFLARVFRPVRTIM